MNAFRTLSDTEEKIGGLISWLGEEIRQKTRDNLSGHVSIDNHAFNCGSLQCAETSLSYAKEIKMGFKTLSELVEENKRLKEENTRMAQLWQAMQLKSDIFDYLCWLETVTQPKEVLGTKFLVLASDKTTCWGKTYAEAARVAMEHDKEIYDATARVTSPT